VLVAGGSERRREPWNQQPASLRRRVTCGKIEPKTPISVVRESSGTALIDGDGGWVCRASGDGTLHRQGQGAWAGHRNGEAESTLRYCQLLLSDVRASRHDRCLVDQRPELLCADFGRQPMTSTNPISVVVPTNREPPFELDFATSSSPRARSGLRPQSEEIPFGWPWTRRVAPPMIHAKPRRRQVPTARRHAGAWPVTKDMAWRCGGYSDRRARRGCLWQPGTAEPPAMKSCATVRHTFLPHCAWTFSDRLTNSRRHGDIAAGVERVGEGRRAGAHLPPTER